MPVLLKFVLVIVFEEDPIAQTSLRIAVISLGFTPVVLRLAHRLAKNWFWHHSALLVIFFFFFLLLLLFLVTQPKAVRVQAIISQSYLFWRVFLLMYTYVSCKQKKKKTKTKKKNQGMGEMRYREEIDRRWGSYKPFISHDISFCLNPQICARVISYFPRRMLSSFINLLNKYLPQSLSPYLPSPSFLHWLYLPPGFATVPMRCYFSQNL